MYQDITTCILIFLCSFLIGFSKSGIPNIASLAVLMMITLYPCKFSLAVLMPILFFADSLALYTYRKYLKIQDSYQLFFSISMGVLAGLLFFTYVKSDLWYRKYIALTLLSLSIFNLVLYKLPQYKPNSYFVPALGFLGGMNTLGAHLGGPFITLALLNQGQAKERLLANRSSLFFLINSFKLPLYFFQETLTTRVLSYCLLSLPFLFLGSYLGYRILPFVRKNNFELISTSFILASSTLVLFAL